MQQNERLKLCPNCDGSVAMEVSVCPYCGSSVFENKEEMAKHNIDDNVKTLSPEETLSSLYPPPYSPKVYDTPIEQEHAQQEVKQEQVIEQKTNSLLPTLFFSLGINIFLLSLLMMMFADDGRVMLKWDYKYWFLYWSVSIPLIYFGYKKLKKLD